MTVDCIRHLRAGLDGMQIHGNGMQSAGRLSRACNGYVASGPIEGEDTNAGIKPYSATATAEATYGSQIKCIGTLVTCPIKSLNFGVSVFRIFRPKDRMA
jgi:hypothetical protein